MSSVKTSSRKNGASSTRVQLVAAAPDRVTPDLIRRRAYEIFQARNGNPGGELSDWIQAEQELTGASRPFEASFP